MTEKPILFSAPMIQAILAGRKTQTRRIIKPKPPDTGSNGGAITGIRSSSLGYGFDANYFGDNPRYIGKCPYGSIGQKLWVRESHAIFCVSGYQAGVGFKAAHPCGGDLSKTDGGYNFYSLEPEQVADAQRMVNPDKWHPSIHMPRWASRITLEITGVRVERLQEITEADAIAEGIAVDECNHVIREDDINWGGAVPEYAALWEKINGAGSWTENPFVWVLEFKIV